MNLTTRDRKALGWGGGGVAIILFTGYILTPMLRHWSENHELLQTRAATVATLREKLADRDALQKRRDVLAMRLGSLRVLHPPIPPEPDLENNVEPGPPGEKAPGEKAPAATAEGPAGAPPVHSPTPPGEESVPEGQRPDAPGHPNPARENANPAEPPPPPPIEASSLATYIEKHAQAAQIKIKRIAPKKNTTGKKQTSYFEPVTLQVSFECQVTGLLALLQRLEKGELFTRIDQLDITRDVNKGDLLSASLDISSYEPRRTAP